MAKRSLADLKSAWKKNATTDSLPNNYYAFYNIDDDAKAVIRFLPDLNDENPLGFMVEKLTHTLKINGKNKTVQCLKQFGKECPICKKSAELYKEEGKDTVVGKRIYRRKQYLAQALVVQDPLKYSDDQPKALGTVKLVNLGFSLVQKINAAFDDDDLDDVPWDYDNGTDFVIKKTKKGEYANYDLSKFANKPRSLTEEERETALAGLIDLATLIPKEPTEEELLKLLDADLNGTPIEEQSSKAPVGSSKGDGNGIDPQSKSKPVAKYGDDDDADGEEEEEDNTPPAKVESTKKVAPVVQEKEEEYSEEADSILAQLRRKREQKAD
jgi:hypothetical protein